jgi:SAM-dependent methyltransferase
MGTRVQPARRLLELGCGPEPARDPCIGIDLDENAARAAAATGVPCVVADARRLPLADRTVDEVLARGVFHHIPNLPVVLGEVRRVLRPDGFLIAVDALPMQAEQYLEMSRQLTERGLPAEPRNGVDPGELTALATAAGFLPPQWSDSGNWTHATPPYVDPCVRQPRDHLHDQGASLTLNSDPLPGFDQDGAHDVSDPAGVPRMINHSLHDAAWPPLRD